MPQALDGFKVPVLSPARAIPHRGIMPCNPRNRWVCQEAPGSESETGPAEPPAACELSTFPQPTHRNSQHITLHLRNKKGQEILRPLPRRSPTFLEIFLPPVLSFIRKIPLSSRERKAVFPGFQEGIELLKKNPRFRGHEDFNKVSQRGGQFQD